MAEGLCSNLNHNSGRYSVSQSLSQPKLSWTHRCLLEPYTISSCTFRSRLAVLLILPEPETSQIYLSMLCQYHLPSLHDFRVRMSYFNLPCLVYVPFSFRPVLDQSPPRMIAEQGLRFLISAFAAAFFGFCPSTLQRPQIFLHSSHDASLIHLSSCGKCRHRLRQSVVVRPVRSKHM